MKREYYVYILSNWNRRVLYIGVTNDLERRIYEHKTGMIKGFTKKYNVHDLVYYETTDDIGVAIAREKQLKGWRRERKLELIKTINPEIKTLL